MISKEVLDSRLIELTNQVNASAAAITTKENDLKQHMANHNALLGAKMVLEQFANSSENQDQLLDLTPAA